MLCYHQLYDCCELIEAMHKPQDGVGQEVLLLCSTTVAADAGPCSQMASPHIYSPSSQAGIYGCLAEFVLGYTIIYSILEKKANI